MNLPEQSGRKPLQSNKKQRVKAHNNDSVDMSDSDEDEYNNTGTIHKRLSVCLFVCPSVCLLVCLFNPTRNKVKAHNNDSVDMSDSDEDEYNNTC
jgi:hypothetical protein